MSNIRYNSLNLPEEVTVGNIEGSGSIKYSYSGTGTKLSTQHINNTYPARSKTTTYVGNLVYENGALKRVLVEGGYVEGGVHHFFLEDYLGNVRVVANAGGAVVQKNAYYPFGMAFAGSPGGAAGGVGASAADQAKQPYKFGGKELDQAFGLDQYDFSARYYDPATARFTSQDPLAEKRYSISPYAYCSNNPITRIDPTGMLDKEWLMNQMTGDVKEIGDRGGQITQHVTYTDENGQTTGSVALPGFGFNVSKDGNNMYTASNMPSKDNKYEYEAGMSMNYSGVTSGTGGVPSNAARITGAAAFGVGSFASVGSQITTDASLVFKGMQSESKALGLGLEYSAEMAKVAKVAKYTKALGWISTGVSFGVTEYQYQTGQISSTGRSIEHVMTGISAIPVIGIPWAIGWELGKAYGPSKW